MPLQTTGPISLGQMADEFGVVRSRVSLGEFRVGGDYGVEQQYAAPGKTFRTSRDHVAMETYLGAARRQLASTAIDDAAIGSVHGVASYVISQNASGVGVVVWAIVGGAPEGSYLSDTSATGATLNVAAIAGDYTIAVSATGSDGVTDVAFFTVSVSVSFADVAIAGASLGSVSAASSYAISQTTANVGDVTWEIVGGAPAGSYLSAINANGATLNVAFVGGDYTIVVRATGSNGVTVTASYTVSVAFADVAFAGASLGDVTAANTYNIVQTAENVGVVTWEIVEGAPPGSSLSATGATGATLTIAYVDGEYSIVVKATGSSGVSVTAVISATIALNAVAIEGGVSLGTVSAATSYAISQTATKVGDVAWEIAGGAPTGSYLSAMNAAGALLNVAYVGGDYTIVVKATGSNGATVTPTYTVSVSFADVALAGASLGRMSAASSYAISQTAENVGDVTWEIVEGAPTGSYLSSNGANGATLNIAFVGGDYTIVVRATGSSGATVTASYTVSVAFADVAIAGASLGLVGAATARTLTQTAANVGDVTWEIAGGAPPGSFLSATGANGATLNVTYVPGEYTIVVKATGSSGAPATASVFVDILAAPNVAPISAQFGDTTSETFSVTPIQTEAHTGNIWWNLEYQLDVALTRQTDLDNPIVEKDWELQIQTYFDPSYFDHATGQITIPVGVMVNKTAFTVTAIGPVGLSSSRTFSLRTFGSKILSPASLPTMTSMVPNLQSSTLLYRLSADAHLNNRAYLFHTRCRGIAPILFVATLDNGYVVAAYSEDVSLNALNQWRPAAPGTCWLNTLQGQNGTVTSNRAYNTVYPETSMYDSIGEGIVFGNVDFAINPYTFVTTHNWNSYAGIAGSLIGDPLPGTSSRTAVELEAFAVPRNVAIEGAALGSVSAATSYVISQTAENVGNVTWEIVGGAPAGSYLSAMNATGATLNVAFVGGDYTIVVRATGSSGVSVTASFTVSVSFADVAIAGASLGDVTAANTYNIVQTAENVGVVAWEIVDGAPPGSFISATGATGATLTIAYVDGEYSIVVKATGSSGVSMTAVFSATIALNTVAIEGAALGSVSAATSYVISQTTAKVGDVAWEIVGGAPAGSYLSAMNAAGATLNVAFVGGDYTIVVRATGSSGVAVTASFTVSVSFADVAITGASLGRMSAASSYAISQTTANVGDVTWEIVEGAPAGSYLSATGATGAIINIAYLRGDYTIVVRATGSNGATVTASYTVSVAFADVAIAGASLGLVGAATARTLTQTAANVGDVTWEIAGGAPAGSYMSATGAAGATLNIAYVPGEYTIVVRATGSSGAPATASVTVDILAAPNVAPISAQFGDTTTDAFVVAPIQTEAHTGYIRWSVNSQLDVTLTRQVVADQTLPELMIQTYFFDLSYFNRRTGQITIPAGAMVNKTAITVTATGPTGLSSSRTFSLRTFGSTILSPAILPTMTSMVPNLQSSSTLLYRLSSDAHFNNKAYLFSTRCRGIAQMVFVAKLDNGCIVTASSEYASYRGQDGSVGNYIVAAPGSCWLNTLQDQNGTLSSTRAYNTVHPEYSLFDNVGAGVTFGGGVVNDFNINDFNINPYTFVTRHAWYSYAGIDGSLLGTPQPGKSTYTTVELEAFAIPRAETSVWIDSASLGDITEVNHYYIAQKVNGTVVGTVTWEIVGGAPAGSYLNATTSYGANLNIPYVDGQYLIVIRATGSSTGESVSAVYTATIALNTVAIAGASLGDVTAANTYNIAQTATKVGNVTWAIVGGAPAGSYLSAVGVNGATLNLAYVDGEYAIVVSATGSNGVTVTAVYTATIALNTVAIAGAALGAVTAATSYAIAQTATKVGNVTWAIVSGAPEGSYMSATGVTGATLNLAYVAGDYTIVVRATGSNGMSAAATYTVSMSYSDVAIAGASLGTLSAATSRLIPQPTGNVGTVVWEIVSGAPEGSYLSGTGAGGAWLNVAYVAGSYTIVVRATGSSGVSSTASFTVSMSVAFPGSVAMTARVSSFNNDTLTCMTKTTDGGFVLTGSGGGAPLITVWSPNGFPTYDIEGPGDFMIRYGPDGEAMWTCTAATPMLVSEFAGNLYATGRLSAYMRNSSGFGGSPVEAVMPAQIGVVDTFVALYDWDGFVQWIAQTSCSTSALVSSSICSDESGVVVMGSFTGTVTFRSSDGTPFDRTLTANASAASLFIVKYTPWGEILWVNSVSGNTAVKVQGKVCLCATSDNGYCATITSSTSTNIYATDGALWKTITGGGGDDIFVVKMTGSGTHEWSARVNSTSSDSGMGVCPAAGCVYVTGYYATGQATAYNADGTSFARKMANAGNNDVCVVKYSLSGAVQWVAKLGSSVDDRSYGVCATGDGGVCVTGYYKGTTLAIVDAAGAAYANPLTRTSSSTNDAFVVKFTDAGAVAWAARCGGTASKIGNAVCPASGGGVFVAGVYNCNPMTVYSSDGTAYGMTLPNDGSTNDIFVVRYT